MFPQQTNKLPQYLITGVVVVFVWTNPEQAADMVNHLFHVIQVMANKLGSHHAG
ncbi:hypothetical protein [Actinomadura oligospora]|uniref:hypothetical protein n=1 Tax=Actinomadura oligospora TaxID=111804 RepID=UPI0004B2EADA|nr:hypothetical protein [Actinomadura oligospora]